MKDILVPLYYFNQNKISNTFSNAKTTTWNLIRGSRRTFDVRAQQDIKTSSYWTLENAPDGFSISDDGVIRADVPHLRTQSPGNLIVNTDKGEIVVPLSVRDWFPNDYRTPRYFFSVARSYDGHVGRDLFDVSIRNSSFVQTGTATIQSGGDGYPDLSPLDGVPNNRYFAISQFYDQVNGLHITPDADAPPAESGLALIGYSANDVNTFFRTPGNMLAAQFEWRMADYAAEGSMLVPAARYDTVDDAVPTFAQPWAMYVIACRLNNGTTPELEAGDFNIYPGLENLDANTYRLRTTNPPLPQSIAAAHQLKWLMLVGDRTLTEQYRDLRRVGLGVYSLEADSSSLSSPARATHHNGSGSLQLYLDEYQFSEWCITELEATGAAGDAWRGDDKFLYINNAVAKWGGESHQFS